MVPFSKKSKPPSTLKHETQIQTPDPKRCMYSKDDGALLEQVAFENAVACDDVQHLLQPYIS